MFISNAVKIAGCAMMFFGVHPLLVLRRGRARCGRLFAGQVRHSHRVPAASALVLANGWIEGLTVAAIILGTFIGGVLDQAVRSPRQLLGFDFPLIDTGIDTVPEMIIAVIGALYLVAALFNLYVPDTGVDHKVLKKNPVYLFHDFNHCLKLLWRDKLGQISLAVTTLFWGAGATLQFIVIKWSEAALQSGSVQRQHAAGRGGRRRRNRRDAGGPHDVLARIAAGDSAGNRHGRGGDRA